MSARVPVITLWLNQLYARFLLLVLNSFVVLPISQSFTRYFLSPPVLIILVVLIFLTPICAYPPGLNLLSTVLLLLNDSVVQQVVYIIDLLGVSSWDWSMMTVFWRTLLLNALLILLELNWLGVLLLALLKLDLIALLNPEIVEGFESLLLFLSQLWFFDLSLSKLLCLRKHIIENTIILIIFLIYHGSLGF